MKIATRLALLHWQANPADPANFWQLVVALMLPGQREPAADKKISETNVPETLGDTERVVPPRERRAKRPILTVPRAIIAGAGLVAAALLLAPRMAPYRAFVRPPDSIWEVDTRTGDVRFCMIELSNAGNGFVCRWEALNAAQ